MPTNLNKTNPTNIISFTLATAVAPAGTVVVAYPNQAFGVINGAGAGYSRGDYLFSDGQHQLILGQTVLNAPVDFTVTFNANASGITITNRSATRTWATGTLVTLQLNPSGRPDTVVAQGPINSGSGLVRVYDYLLDLGSPAAGAATTVCAAQANAAARTLTLNGSLAQTINGVLAAVLDVPRALAFVSSNAGDTTQVITVQGYDVYGAKVQETVALNGTTSVTSRKALVSVTSVAINAATTGNVSVGTANILGLPIAVVRSGQVVRELQDGASATAGTLVVADQATPTNTTGDVRGTYVPNSTPNGNLGFSLFIFTPDPSDTGVNQFGF